MEEPAGQWKWPNFKKILYVYDVERNIGFWYKHEQDSFYTYYQMSEEQIALPTFLPKTAIVGIRNIYNFPDALLELQGTFKRSLNIPNSSAELPFETTFKQSLTI